MENEKNAGGNMLNSPHEMDKLAEELNSMSVEELEEELKILFLEMDEDSFDGELLEMYLDAIERKSPQTRPVDTREAYERFMKRVKAEDKKRRRPRALLKVGIVAAVIAALMAASVAVAYARGIDVFDRIAHWTAEAFGLSMTDKSGKNGAKTPPQLQGMKEAMEQGSIDSNYLPTYWPEGCEESKITASDDPESYMLLGTFGGKGNRIILSYVRLLSGDPKNLYNIDDQSLEFYEHNGIKFHIMTNADKYLAVWTSDNVECRLSGLDSYEELIKILESIGG